MKFNPFKFFLFLFAATFICSCVDTNTPVVASSDPSFISLKFAKNDSIHFLETAVFTLDGTIITNVDSLPFKTRIDSVYPTFSFASTSHITLNENIAGKESVLTSKDKILTGKDTINFTNPVTVTNYAADQITKKTYTVKVNVHKVNPELYVWSKVRANIDAANAVSQKAILLNDKLIYFSNDGFITSCHDLNDGYGLGASTLVAGLPSTVNLRDMVQFGGKLFLTQKSSEIFTFDGVSTWSNKSITGYTFESLLFALDTKLWAVVKSTTDSKYYFANSNDGIVWAVVLTKEVPSNFPMTDFTALSFTSRIGTPKAIVIGGTDLKTRTSWSTENGTYWINLGIENHSLDSLINTPAVVAYDNKLLLFGEGINMKTTNHFRESIDEGLSWRKINNVYNSLPTGCQSRSFQSVVVRKPYKDDKTSGANRIFIVGGKANGTSYSDVWTGKLNRKSFIRQ